MILFFRFILSLVAFLFSLTCLAQENKKFYGTVIDLNSKEVLENVSVYLKNGNQGTFTNKEGNFVFNTSVEEGILVFQLIGYKPYEISLGSESDDLSISLQRDPFFLDEIVVKADSSRQIMKEAFSRIKKNYPNKQYLLKGYYRESVLRDEEYVRFLDAAVGINDFSYRSDPLRRKIEVYNLRKSEDYVKEDLLTQLLSLVFNKDNDFLIGLNFRDILRRYHREPSYFRGMNDDLLDFFDFKVDSILNSGEEPVAKISFSAPTSMFSTNGFFLVNLSDYGVISIEMTRVPTDRFITDVFMKKAMSSVSVVEYRKVNDRYYLSRFFSQGTENLAALDTDTKSGAQILKMELWVNEVFDNKRFFEKIKNKNKLDWETELKDLDIPYDSAFWKSYNFIPDSIEYQKMVRDLEMLKSNE